MFVRVNSRDISIVINGQTEEVSLDFDYQKVFRRSSLASTKDLAGIYKGNLNYARLASTDIGNHVEAGVDYRHYDDSSCNCILCWMKHTKFTPYSVPLVKAKLLCIVDVMKQVALHEKMSFSHFKTAIKPLVSTEPDDSPVYMILWEMLFSVQPPREGEVLEPIWDNLISGSGDETKTTVSVKQVLIELQKKENDMFERKTLLYELSNCNLTVRHLRKLSNFLQGQSREIHNEFDTHKRKYLSTLEFIVLFVEESIFEKVNLVDENFDAVIDSYVGDQNITVEQSNSLLEFDKSKEYVDFLNTYKFEYFKQYCSIRQIEGLTQLLEVFDDERKLWEALQGKTVDPPGVKRNFTTMLEREISKRKQIKLSLTFEEMVTKKDGQFQSRYPQYMHVLKNLYDKYNDLDKAMARTKETIRIDETDMEILKLLAFKKNARRNPEFNVRLRARMKSSYDTLPEQSKRDIDQKLIFDKYMRMQLFMQKNKIETNYDKSKAFQEYVSSRTPEDKLAVTQEYKVSNSSAVMTFDEWYWKRLYMIFFRRCGPNQIKSLHVWETGMNSDMKTMFNQKWNDVAPLLRWKEAVGIEQNMMEYDTELDLAIQQQMHVDIFGNGNTQNELNDYISRNLHPLERKKFKTALRLLNNDEASIKDFSKISNRYEQMQAEIDRGDGDSDRLRTLQSLMNETPDTIRAKIKKSEDKKKEITNWLENDVPKIEKKIRVMEAQPSPDRARIQEEQKKLNTVPKLTIFLDKLRESIKSQVQMRRTVDKRFNASHKLAKLNAGIVNRRQAFLQMQGFYRNEVYLRMFQKKMTELTLLERGGFNDEKSFYYGAWSAFRHRHKTQLIHKGDKVVIVDYFDILKSWDSGGLTTNRYIRETLFNRGDIYGLQQFNRLSAKYNRFCQQVQDELGETKAQECFVPPLKDLKLIQDLDKYVDFEVTEGMKRNISRYACQDRQSIVCHFDDFMQQFETDRDMFKLRSMLFSSVLKEGKKLNAWVENIDGNNVCVYLENPKKNNRTISIQDGSGATVTVEQELVVNRITMSMDYVFPSEQDFIWNQKKTIEQEEEDKRIQDEMTAADRILAEKRKLMQDALYKKEIEAERERNLLKTQEQIERVRFDIEKQEQLYTRWYKTFSKSDPTSFLSHIVEECKNDTNKPYMFKAASTRREDREGDQFRRMVNRRIQRFNISKSNIQTNILLTLMGWRRIRGNNPPELKTTDDRRRWIESQLAQLVGTRAKKLSKLNEMKKDIASSKRRYLKKHEVIPRRVRDTWDNIDAVFEDVINKTKNADINISVQYSDPEETVYYINYLLEDEVDRILHTPPEFFTHENWDIDVLRSTIELTTPEHEMLENYMIEKERKVQWKTKQSGRKRKRAGESKSDSGTESDYQHDYAIRSDSDRGALKSFYPEGSPELKEEISTLTPPGPSTAKRRLPIRFRLGPGAWYELNSGSELMRYTGLGRLEREELQRTVDKKAAVFKAQMILESLKTVDDAILRSEIEKSITRRSNELAIIETIKNTDTYTIEEKRLIEAEELWITQMRGSNNKKTTFEEYTLAEYKWMRSDSTDIRFLDDIIGRFEWDLQTGVVKQAVSFGSMPPTHMCLNYFYLDTIKKNRTINDVRREKVFYVELVPCFVVSFYRKGTQGYRRIPVRNRADETFDVKKEKLNRPYNATDYRGFTHSVCLSESEFKQLAGLQMGTSDRALQDVSYPIVAKYHNIKMAQQRDIAETKLMNRKRNLPELVDLPDIGEPDTFTNPLQAGFFYTQHDVTNLDVRDMDGRGILAFMVDSAVCFIDTAGAQMGVLRINDMLSWQRGPGLVTDVNGKLKVCQPDGTKSDLLQFRGVSRERSLVNMYGEKIKSVEYSKRKITHVAYSGNKTAICLQVGSKSKIYICESGVPPTRIATLDDVRSMVWEIDLTVAGEVQKSNKLLIYKNNQWISSNTYGVTCMAGSRDSVVTGSNDGTLTIWKVRDLLLVKDTHVVVTKTITANETSKRLTSKRFGKILSINDSTYTIKLFATTKKKRRIAQTSEDIVKESDISGGIPYFQGGNSIVERSFHDSTLSGHTGRITDVVWGNDIVSASEDETIRVWNIDGLKYKLDLRILGFQPMRSAPKIKIALWGQLLFYARGSFIGMYDTTQHKRQKFKNTELDVTLPQRITYDFGTKVVDDETFSDNHDLFPNIYITWKRNRVPKPKKTKRKTKADAMGLTEQEYEEFKTWMIEEERKFQEKLHKDYRNRTNLTVNDYKLLQRLHRQAKALGMSVERLGEYLNMQEELEFDADSRSAVFFGLDVLTYRIKTPIDRAAHAAAESMELVNTYTGIVEKKRFLRRVFRVYILNDRKNIMKHIQEETLRLGFKSFEAYLELLGTVQDKKVYESYLKYRIKEDMKHIQQNLRPDESVEDYLDANGTEHDKEVYQSYLKYKESELDDMYPEYKDIVERARQWEDTFGISESDYEEMDNKETFDKEREVIRNEISELEKKELVYLNQLDALANKLSLESRYELLDVDDFEKLFIENTPPEYSAGDIEDMYDQWNTKAEPRGYSKSEEAKKRDRVIKIWKKTN